MASISIQIIKANIGAISFTLATDMKHHQNGEM